MGGTRKMDVTTDFTIIVISINGDAGLCNTEYWSELIKKGSQSSQREQFYSFIE
jgi:hypothetical protein